MQPLFQKKLFRIFISILLSRCIPIHLRLRRFCIFLFVKLTSYQTTYTNEHTTYQYHISFPLFHIRSPHILSAIFFLYCSIVLTHLPELQTILFVFRQISFKLSIQQITYQKYECNFVYFSDTRKELPHTTSQHLFKIQQTIKRITLTHNL